MKLRCLSPVEWLLATGMLAATAGEPPSRPAARAGEFRLPLLSQNRQTGLLTGTGARTQPDGTIFLETARVEHIYPAGPTNLPLVIQATRCLVDLRQNRVSSPEELRVTTPDGQLALEGVGFLWLQSTSELVVSNQVRARLRKRPGDPAPEGASLTLEAGEMHLNLATNVVTFGRGVQVADPELEVRAERLTARRNPAGRFDRLEVEGHVEILSRRDGSRTTSEHAEYRLTGPGEEVELTGRPRWTDAVREASAERFFLQRSPGGGPQHLQALGRAVLVLPLGTNSLHLGPLSAGVPAPAAGSTPPADRVRLSAEALTLFLPPGPGPVRGLWAETNVVLADTAEVWRATAARAAFTNDVLELSGAPHWSGRDREVRGAVLRLDLAQRRVEVRGGAWLRLPVSAFEPPRAAAPGPSAAADRARRRWFVTVEADAAQFTAGQLTFAPPVRARLFEGEQTLGELTCRELTVSYPERLEALEAAGAVRIEQCASPARPGLSRHLACERLRVTFAEAGTLQHLEATGGVRAEQREAPRPGTEPRRTEVRAGHLEAWFRADTNRLDRAVAAEQVRVTRGKRRAEGERATYTEATGVLELTGAPRVETPDGRVTGAEALRWDTRRNRAGGRGAFHIEWTALPAALRTNVLARPFAP